jgi:hypothetical protein
VNKRSAKRDPHSLDAKWEAEEAARLWKMVCDTPDGQPLSLTDNQVRLLQRRGYKSKSLADYW